MGTAAQEDIKHFITIIFALEVKNTGKHLFF